MDNIAFNFFKEFRYPKQIQGMLREPTYLPQWLTLQNIPADKHQEAITLIKEVANRLI